MTKDKKSNTLQPAEPLESKILTFLNFAMKISSNPYYSREDKSRLVSYGEKLGLPHIIIDEVIRTFSVNNGNISKEIVTASADLRNLKAAYASALATNYTIGSTGVSVSSIIKQPYFSAPIATSTPYEHTNLLATSKVQQYQSSIAGLQNHLEELKVTSSGEGDKQTDKQKLKSLESKTLSDKATIQMSPLTKKINYSNSH